VYAINVNATCILLCATLVEHCFPFAREATLDRIWVLMKLVLCFPLFIKVQPMPEPPGLLPWCSVWMCMIVGSLATFGAARCTVRRSYILILLGCCSHAATSWYVKAKSRVVLQRNGCFLKLKMGTPNSSTIYQFSWGNQWFGVFV
jgi:hypothetical protein